VIDVINDVVFFADVVGGANNPDRFVEGNINEIFLGRTYRFVVYGDNTPGMTLVPISGTCPLIMTLPRSMSWSAALREQ
jgi:hypothetical protein